MATKTLFFLIFLCILSSSTFASLSNQSLFNAAESLSTSGYFSMSLTLQVAANAIIQQVKSSSLTIFFPPDAAFSQMGQPGFDLLLFHFSPSSFPVHSLQSLPLGSKISTLLSNQSLVITSKGDFDGVISINNAKIWGVPLYDDGSLVIFGIDKFFDPDFDAKPQVQTPKGGDHGGSTCDGGDHGRRSRGGGGEVRLRRETGQAAAPPTVERKKEEEERRKEEKMMWQPSTSYSTWQPTWQPNCCHMGAKGE